VVVLLLVLDTVQRFLGGLEALGGGLGGGAGG
jgi:hypothetical protein